MSDKPMERDPLVHTGQAVGWYRCDGKACLICGTKEASTDTPLEQRMLELLESHIPLDGGCGGDPGESGCSCDAAFTPYTWRGYCGHVAAILATLLTKEVKAARLDEARDWLMSEALNNKARLEWKRRRISELEANK